MLLFKINTFGDSKANDDEKKALVINSVITEKSQEIANFIPPR